MADYLAEPGQVFDCLQFLSLCFETKEQDMPAAYYEVKAALQTETIPQSHLSLLIGSGQKNYSFLQYVVFEQSPYSQCSFRKIEKILSNVSYVRQKLLEYLMPHEESSTYRKLIKMEYPYAMEVINRIDMPEDHKIKISWILFRLENVLDEIIRILNCIRLKIEELHRQWIDQNDEKLREIQKHSVKDKLKSISGAEEKSFIFYSVTLMEEKQILFHLTEPNFVLLGSSFDEVLETKYKYRQVTPSTFIRALENETKRIIFEALLNMVPLSAADMEEQLHLSRNTVARNIKEMRESGIVKLSHIKGLSYYHILDKDYVAAVLERFQEIIT